MKYKFSELQGHTVKGIDLAAELSVSPGGLVNYRHGGIVGDVVDRRYSAKNIFSLLVGLELMDMNVSQKNAASATEQVRTLWDNYSRGVEHVKSTTDGMNIIRTDVESFAKKALVVTMRSVDNFSAKPVASFIGLNGKASGPSEDGVMCYVRLDRIWDRMCEILWFCGGVSTKDEKMANEPGIDVDAGMRKTQRPEAETTWAEKTVETR